MNDSMDAYEKLADEHTAAPASAPVAQFSGEQAAGIMASFMEPDADASAIFSAIPTMAGPGRPSANEKREESVQERFRIPQSWSAYIEHAVRREGLSSKSEYLRTLVAKDAEAHHEEHRLQMA